MSTNNISNTLNINYLHNHYDALVSNTTANAYWKDRQGKYLGGNPWQVKRCGAASLDSLIGSSDFELAWHKAAPTFQTNDRAIIDSEQAFLFIEPIEKSQAYLSYKSPLLNQMNKVIGVFGISYLISSHTDQQPQMLRELSMLGSSFVADYAKQLLSQFRNNIQLTARQSECLTLWANGMTMREIACQLELSHRTVEHYLNTIKSKLGCTTRSELIVKSRALCLLK